MVGGVVLNQKHPVSTPIKRGHQDLVQKPHVGFPLEVLLLMKINKPGVLQTHRPENLLRVALSPRRNLRLAGPPRPSRVQGRRLAERGFILEDDYRPFPPGFFLRRG